jgi:hypothetical protein
MMNPSARRPGIVALATMAFAQTADLLQTEFRLARAELADKMSALRTGLILIVVCAIFLIVALGMFLQALVAGGVSPVAAILIVAGGAAALGLVLFIAGQSRLNPEHLTPDRTLNSLSRTLVW